MKHIILIALIALSGCAVVKEIAINETEHRLRIKTYELINEGVAVGSPEACGLAADVIHFGTQAHNFFNDEPVNAIVLRGKVTDFMVEKGFTTQTQGVVLRAGKAAIQIVQSISSNDGEAKMNLGDFIRSVVWGAEDVKKQCFLAETQD